MAATVHLLGLGDIFTVCIVSGVHCTVQAEAEESLFLQLAAALLCCCATVACAILCCAVLLCRAVSLLCRVPASAELQIRPPWCDQGKPQSPKLGRSQSTGP